MKKKQVMALMLVMALAAQTAGGSVAASAGAKKTTDSASSESADSENESTSSGTASTDSDVSGSDLENAMESAAGVTADGAAKKEETVYVFTDAKGSQKKITVSNWLKNENGDDTLQDETTLDDVQNVEGDETFKQDWRYTLLPVWIVTYKFNGQLLPFAINGQTGKTYGKLPIALGKVIGIAAVIAVIIFALATLGGMLFL